MPEFIFALNIFKSATKEGGPSVEKWEQIECRIYTTKVNALHKLAFINFP